MIIAGDFELPVGVMVTVPAVTDADGRRHNDVRVLVVREATVDEYLAWCAEASGLEPRLPYGNRFYDVRTD